MIADFNYSTAQNCVLSIVGAPPLHLLDVFEVKVNSSSFSMKN